MVLPSVVAATLAGISTVVLAWVSGPVRAQEAEEPLVISLPTADAGAPGPPAQEKIPAVPSEPTRVPASEEREAEIPTASARHAQSPLLATVPVARTRRPIRSERFFAVAFTTGLIVLPETAPLPLPELGVDVGVNLGPHLMINVGGGFAQIVGGAKVFLGKGDIVPYVVARLGTTPWTGLFASSGLGVDVSRSDGTYAFAEVSPMLARSKRNDYNPVPAEHWKTVDVQATFGYGKRY